MGCLEPTQKLETIVRRPPTLRPTTQPQDVVAIMAASVFTCVFSHTVFLHIIVKQIRFQGRFGFVNIVRCFLYLWKYQEYI